MRKMHRRKPNLKCGRQVSQKRDVIAQYLRLVRNNFPTPHGNAQAVVSLPRQETESNA